VTTKDPDQFQYFTKMDKPYGNTYGEWTVKWWQWALSIAKDIHPIADPTGRNWRTHQPMSGVYFLVGNVAHIDKIYHHRDITMEYGRSLLIPVLNCEANSLEYPFLETHEDLIRYVEHDVSTVKKKEIFINGLPIDVTRVTSDPKIFKLTINQDNAFGLSTPGSTYAAADGYWLFLKPLPRGRYSINFEGSCEGGRLNAGASYDIDIK
jgi:hypothetical protein